MVFIVSFIALAVALAVSYMTMGIVSGGRGSDADKQINAAAHFNEWRWPSDMHKYAGEKAWLKDMGVIGLAIVQRIMNDTKSFHPVVVLCALANAVASILVYIVASAYWGQSVGVVMFALYLICLWPYQVVIQGGYQVLGIAFFLLSVYFLQLSGISGYFYLFSGMAVTAMMFSSASSRKLLPLYLAAFIFSQRAHIDLFLFSPDAWGSLSHSFGLMLVQGFILTGLLLAAGVIFLALSYDRIIRKMHSQQLPRKICDLFMKSRDKFPLEHYLNKRKKILWFYFNLFFKIILFYMVLLSLSRSPSFYVAQLFVVCGIGMVGFALLFPKIQDGLRGFYSYWTISKWGGHFRIYKDYFEKIGKPIKDDMYGAGIIWYPKIFWRMIPFHYTYYLLAVVFLFSMTMIGGLSPWQVIPIIIIGLLPIIYGELTKGPQFSRTYFPVFLGLLLTIGYGLFNLEKLLSLPLFWAVCSSVVFVSAMWNIWVFLDDVLPARMTVPRILGKLKALGVKRFYTYNNPYNKPCVFAFNQADLDKFEVKFVSSLDEVKDGYVVIPGTSSKSVAMESASYAIKHGDFDEDPVLNELIRSKDLAKYAVASFKTVGTSGFWGQEGEVPSYRDLILKEVDQDDRYRSLAWIIDGAKLSADRGGIL